MDTYIDFGFFPNTDMDMDIRLIVIQLYLSTSTHNFVSVYEDAN